MDEFISKQVLKDLGAECIAKRNIRGNLIPLGSIDSLPSVNPQANREDIHREREQAYMKGYEDASNRYRTEPCGDAISRTDAIRVASGYCHWSNIPAELEKLPSVNPIPCEDAISRQTVLNYIWNDLELGDEENGADLERKMELEESFRYIKALPSVSTEKTGRWSRKTKVDAYDLCGVKTWGIKCQCDRCTFTTTVVEDFGYYKYCPNCGSRMEG